VDFFWSLPKSSLAGLEHSFGDLFASSQPRRFEAGSILSDPSSAPERAFLCTSGTLKVTKLLSNGREILITILESGSIWSDRSLLKGYWREVFIETISPTETVSIDREAFEKFLYAHPERLTQFMTRISEQMSDALTLLEDFRGRDVASRLASVLVRFSKRKVGRHRTPLHPPGPRKYDRDRPRDRQPQHGALPRRRLRRRECCGYARNSQPQRPRGARLRAASSPLARQSPGPRFDVASPYLGRLGRRTAGDNCHGSRPPGSVR
jgi:CRP-like cAMP-binding protein